MGVRYKRDTDIKLCIDLKSAQKVARQILSQHPEDLIEEDMEIIQIPCPSLFGMIVNYFKDILKQGGKYVRNIIAN
jgi:hypothetical protein